jgi:g-D-glutamyl-meso-diaminopimelate peptidase
MYNSVWQENRLVPIRTAKQMLKQTKFNGDKKTALIYKKSLIVLKENIVSDKNINYISIPDAESLGFSSLGQSAQDRLTGSQLELNKVTYISLDSLVKGLGLTCKYEKTTNTFYIS